MIIIHHYRRYYERDSIRHVREMGETTRRDVCRRGVEKERAGERCGDLERRMERESERERERERERENVIGLRRAVG